MYWTGDSEEKFSEKKKMIKKCKAGFKQMQ